MNRENSNTAEWLDYLSDEIEPTEFDLYHYLKLYGTAQRIEKGSYLYSMDEEKIPDLVLVDRGEIKASQITLSGEEQIFNVFREGSVLFLPSITNGTLPSLDFIALTRCDLTVIPHDQASELIFNNLTAATLVIREQSNRLINAHKRLRETDMYSSDWKICNLILDFAERKGVEYDGKILIQEKISQQYMANMIRISRITVARKLKELKDLGLLESINGYLCIRDEKKLRQHMYYISIPLE